MTLRSPRERLIQTAAFETGGLLLCTPLFWLLFGGTLADSGLLLVLLTVALLIWAPLHNIAADLLEHRLTGRVASDRPHVWRLVHAVSIEVTSMLVTVPLNMWFTHASLPEALVISVGMTLFYVVYAYLFHLVYDALRPVRPVGTAPEQRRRRGAVPVGRQGWQQ